MNGNRSFFKKGRSWQMKFLFHNQPCISARETTSTERLQWRRKPSKVCWCCNLMHCSISSFASLTRCWCFWTSWSGNTYFIKVLFDKKYNTSWMNILFHGKLYQMKYHKIQTKWNWRHAYLVLMLLNSQHFAKWAASKSRHQYENGRNK